MIDIHTHIIPALDDGPPDMETSIGMGRIAVKEGIAAMIATPHSHEAMAAGHEDIQARLEEVRSAWAEAGLGIRLETGLEIFLRPDTVEDLKSGRAWTLAGGQYVLVEVPYQPWPAYADQALFELQVAGYTPILAHPERYTAIQDDPNRMYALTERGVLGQVTGTAFLGEHGPAARHCAETLVRHGLAQFLSSDAHGVTARKREPMLRRALKAAEQLVGPEAAWALVADNPAHILSNTLISPSPERVTARRWSLGGIFRGG
jgi:protein-tyrosine phosphatase